MLNSTKKSSKKLSENWVRSEKKRNIDRLREHYGGKWAYDHVSKWWVNSDGWHVYSVATLTPVHAWDDDTFTVRYYRSDTLEQVYGLKGEGLQL